MRWCKAVLPCTSWTSISQPVWRRCKFTVSTTMESLFNQSEHVEHWDKRLVTFVKSSGFSDGEVSLREIPPSRQNSNKGLEEVKPAIESNGNFIKKFSIGISHWENKWFPWEDIPAKDLPSFKKSRVFWKPLIWSYKFFDSEQNLCRQITPASSWRLLYQTKWTLLLSI